MTYITELIQAGVDLNYYIYGDTPLLLSISKGHQVIAELLSAADRCDVSLAEDMESRRSPIHVAARNGYTKVVQNILDRGGDVNVRDALFMTPLHMAAVGGNPSTVQCLLDNGADIAATDISRRTPLNRAAEYNHHGIIRRLWHAGSDINHRDRFGWTALFHSVACGHHATVEVLLECNIDVNLQCDGGETVLHLAAHRLRHSILNRLQSGSDINFYSRTVEMPTQAVHEAISKTCAGMNILHLLLNYGADVNVFNKSGLAPICLAAIVGREDMMRLMIECGLRVYQHISPEDSQQAIEMELRAALDTSMSCYCIENCCDFLQLSTHQQFPSLATLCRTSIRKALVKPINAHVASLPLPAQLLNEIRIPTDFHEIHIPTDFPGIHITTDFPAVNGD